MNVWAWRIDDGTRSYGTGTAISRDGLANQIREAIAHCPIYLTDTRNTRLTLTLDYLQEK